MKVKITELMNRSGVKFGTSGARGLVADMTDRVCYAYTCGFLQYLECTDAIERGARVAVAGDLRPSTGRIMAAVARAAADKGYTPVNCGRIPSPAVALYGLDQQIPAIMITGSHIPADRNGIKFNIPTGEILKADETGIKEQVVVIDDDLFSPEGRFLQDADLPIEDRRARDSYVKRYVNFFGPAALEGMRIAVYQHSAVGKDMMVEIYQKLGATVTPLGASKDFIPVDTEAIRGEDVELAAQWATSGDYMSIVSTDGDSDRPLISDETGVWLRGDVAGILCAHYLKADAVCTPVSCNSAVEKSGFFHTVIRTRIGSPFVIAAMNDAVARGGNMVVGYEANGGFLTNSPFQQGENALRALPTRDAVILHIAILMLAKHRDVPISQLVSELPARFTASDRLQGVSQEQSRQILQRISTGDQKTDAAAIIDMFGELCGAVVGIDRTDGVRITFENQEVIHLRPSGNAPEFRCYTEAESDERARALNDHCMRVLRPH